MKNGFLASVLVAGLVGVSSGALAHDAPAGEWVLSALPVPFTTLVETGPGASKTYRVCVDVLKNQEINVIVTGSGVTRPTGETIVMTLRYRGACSDILVGSNAKIFLSLPPGTPGKGRNTGTYGRVE